MPFTWPKWKSSLQQTQVDAAVPLLENSEARGTDKHNQNVFDSIHLTVVKKDNKTIILISMESGRYQFLNSNARKKGYRSIQFIKNEKIVNEKIVLDNKAETVQMSDAHDFLNSHVAQAGTVIKELTLSHQYPMTDTIFRTLMFALLKSERLKIEKLSFYTSEKNVDQPFLDFLNNMNTENIYVFFRMQNTNSDFVHNLNCKMLEIEDIYFSETLFIRHCQKLIAKNKVIGSLYHSNDRNGILTKSFFEINCADLQLVDAKHIRKIYDKSDPPLPLTFTRQISPTTVLEIYNDKEDVIALLAKAKAPPVPKTL